MMPVSLVSPLTGRPASSRALGDGFLWTLLAEDDHLTYAATAVALGALRASPPAALAAVLTRVAGLSRESLCAALVSRAEHRGRISPPAGPLRFRLLVV